jgi:hypothetical protein
MTRNAYRPDGAIRLRVVPIELKEANALVAAWHRHHKPCQGHRFSLGAIDDDDNLRGAIIIGRPVARLAGHPRVVLEVTRLVTDGTPNVCSMLYAAAARVGKALGYARIQTYILEEETGITLKATGWECEGTAGGGQWKHTDGKPRRTDQPTGVKTRWSKRLNDEAPIIVRVPEVADGDRDESSLFAAGEI